ncbi:MAG: penicillin acylase family protein, partial [Promethearchaeota archaeon]
MPSTKLKVSKLVVSIALVCSVSILLSVPIDIIPPLGNLINPFTGIWTVPLTAEHPVSQTIIAPSKVSSPVTVIRDSWGIPHIYAENDEDLYFAFGYVHAQDRLWQMDIMRRTGRGLLSEILGADYVSTDVFLRTIGMEHAAKVTIDLMEQQSDSFNQTLMNDLSSYTDGVNWFISNVGFNLPLEFKLLNYRPAPWSLIDSIVIGRVMAFELTWETYDLEFSKIHNALGNESAWELFPLVPPLQIPVVPEYGISYPVPPTTSSTSSEETFSEDLLCAFDSVRAWNEQVKDPFGILAAMKEGWPGSNNWAVNGTKSATGKPILCNDMHLSWSIPSVWYQAHCVSSDSGLNIYGFTLPGIPLTIVGHNEHLAWGFTNVGPDVMDWYYYVMDDQDNPTQYWYDNKWNPIQEETITIPVKGAFPVTTTIRRTVHGPILSGYEATVGSSNYSVAQRWTGYDASYEMRAFYKMNHATNYAEFIDGQREFWSPAQNIVYADIDGNIAIRPTGHIPIRDSYPYGRLPLNGSDGEGEWNDYIPFSELPLSLNPSQGYVASANQLSALYPNYPYFIHSYIDPGYRARRINWLLSSDDSVTVEDMKTYQLDIVDNASSAFVPYLLAAYSGASPSFKTATLNAAISYLNAWDYTMDKDLVAPTIWRAWWEYYEEDVFDDEYADAGISNLGYPSMVILENLTRNGPTSH